MASVNDFGSKDKVLALDQIKVCKLGIARVTTGNGLTWKNDTEDAAVGQKWFAKRDNRGKCCESLVNIICWCVWQKLTYPDRVCPLTSILHHYRPVWKSRCSRRCRGLSLLSCRHMCSPKYLCQNSSRKGRPSERFPVCSLWDKHYINYCATKEGAQKTPKLPALPLLLTKVRVCIHKIRTPILPIVFILSLREWTESQKHKEDNEILIQGEGEGWGWMGVWV